jgi:uncharacterized protein (TIGR02757 family)
MDRYKIKELLEKEVKSRNSIEELSYDKPDPLLIAKRYKDEYIALVCALFAYGSAKQIVKFLDSLDFSLLDRDEIDIKEALVNHYYRFQKSEDVIALFIALSRLKKERSLEDIFLDGYSKGTLLDGLWSLISAIREAYLYSSRGYDFLVGKVPKNINRAGTYKRYLMYLRWVVRDDNLDLGLWSRVDKSDLIIPLDTHTFNVSLRLGLLKRKSYDLRASMELTSVLREFDSSDPVKYDFAIYRLGQEKIV